MSLYKEYIMNEEAFNKISAGVIMRVVVTRELGFYISEGVKDQQLMFVAKKGNNNDWAVYVGKLTNSADLNTISHWPSVLDSYIDAVEFIRAHGDKSKTEAVIRNILPCTDEVYLKYRH